MGKLETDRLPVELPHYGVVSYNDILTACRTGDIAFIEALLAVPHATLHHAEDATGLTPLHYAAAYNARKVVVTLVNSGRCPLDATDRWGRTPARLAYEIADNPAMGRYLLQKQFAPPPAVVEPPPGVVPFPRRR